MADDGAPGMAALDDDALAAYLAGRRWSGARGGELRVVGRDAPRVLFHEPSALLATVAVRVAGGTPYELALPLALSARPGEIADATQDGAFRMALFDAVRGARAFASPEVVARGDDVATMPAATSSRVSTAEQSNTSMIYEGPEGAAIVKLFRRVEVGENPDVEIGRFLTRRGFPHVPRLYGTVVLRRPEGEATIAMAQALVPGAEDAWAFATRAAGEALGASDDAGARAATDAYAAEAARLGTVTRAMHDALAGTASDGAAADPAFAPEPARYGDVRRWAQGTLAAYDAMLAAAAAAGTALDADVLDRTAAVERVDALAAAVGDDAGAAIRHHGDYHLGQVLRASDGGLFVVDFEGEPARPLAERRRKHSPLRDVAGMLRSFAYAAAFASRGAAGRDAADIAPRADAWERAARDAFLAAYFAPARPGASYLPHARARADALVALFETEKLYYELRYELGNRPDWVEIPLRGLTRASRG